MRASAVARPVFGGPLVREANAFLEACFTETDRLDELPVRRREVEAEIAATGSYTHTFAELEHGARMAWRNSTRCIGRLYWPSLALLDFRHLTEPDEIFAALIEYLGYATNGGAIRPAIAVFPQAPAEGPGIRIWNDQLIRYAGHTLPDGSILGDPAQAEFTAAVRRLGWQGGAETRFDVLPLVIEVPGEGPRLYELPAEAVLEVPLVHPQFPWFADLGLQWHALPSIANMRLEVGGISYTAAPFNGWYMGTEIGARNLGDAERYDLLPEVAARMGLDTRNDRSLWRDRALVELNAAVLHSYEAAGVKMVDHHTAGRHFLRFEAKEASSGRETAGDWSWLVPPISGSTCPVFHRPYENREETPNYFVQGKPWREGTGQAGACPVRN